MSKDKKSQVEASGNTSRNIPQGIQSMTGFGRGEIQKNGLVAVVEIKCVNHRYKEARFRLPSQHNVLEMEFRDHLFTYFKRGSFDIWATIKEIAQGSSNQELNIDKNKLHSWIGLARDTAKGMGINFELRLSDVLRPEFHHESNENELIEQTTFLKQAFFEATKNLLDARSKEGSKLVLALGEHIGQYKNSFKTIEAQAKDHRPKVEERLRLRFKEFQKDLGNLDEPRFLQEVIYYLEKLDISEEITRIHAHLGKLEGILKKGDEAGRQIDFIVQELNRETNTIGSKANDLLVTDAVVGMKGQLEKIREQGLNIE